MSDSRAACGDVSSFAVCASTRVQEASGARGIRLGKGSHGVLVLGNRRTVVRNTRDELKTGTMHAMLRQLGITLDDLRQ
jgi:predicted RNA binding protein YcfA (HicA-like mRNA interferase family)